MARQSIDQKFDKFITENIELVSEYESGEGAVPIDQCKGELLQEYDSLRKCHSGIDFNTVFEDTFTRAIQKSDTALESLQEIRRMYDQNLYSTNSTQTYFNEVGKIYDSHGNDFDIEYCEENRDKLIEMNLKSVISVAKRYQGLGCSLQELISAGNLGLVTAFDKFDPDKAKLKTNVLEAVKGLDDFTYNDLLGRIGHLVTYGKIREKMEQRFSGPGRYTAEELNKWINKNIRNAKFSSVVFMWVRAYIMIELDNHSRMVKKPKSEIYKDKLKTGSYSTETILGLDRPISGDSDTTFGDTIPYDYDDEEFTELEVMEAYDEFRDALNLMLDGVCQRDRVVFLKKFGIGLPRPLLPKEIADQEDLSVARISQIFQNVMTKVRKNCSKYNIDPGPLFESCRKFR